MKAPGSTPKRQRRFLMRGVKLLKRATNRARIAMQRGDVPATCATELIDRLTDAQTRARDVADVR
jgi:hypothetical protein